MRIRLFRVGDEAALFHVYYSAIHEVACRDYNRQQLDAWAPANMDMDVWRERIRAIKPFVVEVDGEIAAYADVQPSGYIDHFFVAGAHAGGGIGKILMNRIHEQAAYQRLTELTSEVSRTAQPFFAYFGFEIAEQRMPVVRGVTVPNALMRKKLSPIDPHSRKILRV